MPRPPAPTATPAAMSPTDWLMLAVLSLLWGGSFLFVGIAVEHLPPLTIVAARTVIGALMLLTVARLSGHRLPRDGATWGGLALLSVMGNLVPFSAIAWGQNHIPSGLAAILNATTPLGTVLLLRVVQAERIGMWKAAGLAFGFSGVCLLIGPKALAGANAQLLGALAVLVGALSYSGAGVWAHRFKHLPPSVTSGGSLAVTALVSVPLALAVDRPWLLSPSPAAIGAVLALGIVSTGLAYLLFYRILNRAGPASASLVTFLIPVSAILLGAVVLGERLEWYAFAGMGLIFAGLAAIDGRLVGAARRPSTTADQNA